MLTEFAIQHITWCIEVVQKLVLSVFLGTQQAFLTALTASLAAALACLNFLRRAGGVFEMAQGLSNVLDKNVPISTENRSSAKIR